MWRTTTSNWQKQKSQVRALRLPVPGCCFAPAPYRFPRRRVGDWDSAQGAARAAAEEGACLGVSCCRSGAIECDGNEAVIYAQQYEEECLPKGLPIQRITHATKLASACDVARPTPWRSGHTLTRSIVALQCWLFVCPRAPTVQVNRKISKNSKKGGKVQVNENISRLSSPPSTGGV